MGLFFGNYNKPGPGISKDAPKKRRFFLYWDMLFEKYRKIIFLNLLFVAFSIIPLILAGIVYYFSDSLLLGGILLIPVCIPLCALSRCTKKLACDEPIFAFSDFLDAVKENCKQALVLGVIDYCATVFFVVMFKFFVKNMESSPIFVLFFIVSCIFALYFLFMQWYLFLFTVTFELTIPEILKNSVIFSLVNIKSNFLVTFITAVIAFLVALSFELIETPIFSGISIVLLVLIAFAFIQFTANFAVWPKVYELMIAPYEQEKTEEQGTEDADSADLPFPAGPVFKDGKLVIKEKMIMNKYINKKPASLAIGLWGQIAIAIVFCFVINITFSEYLLTDNYIFLTIMQFVEIIIYGGLIYRFFWTVGNGDLNKVNFGKEKRDFFKGFKASVIASVPHFIVYILLIVSKVKGISNAFLVIYKILGAPFVPLVFRFTLKTGMITEASLSGIMISGLTLLILPAVGTAAYMLGISDYSISQNLIYKNLNGDKGSSIRKIKR